jgi:hypothetical protein
LDLPEAEIQDLLRFTGAATVPEAVRAAVIEFNRQKCVAALARYAGHGELLDTPESLQASRRDPPKF